MSTQGIIATTKQVTEFKLDIGQRGPAGIAGEAFHGQVAITPGTVTGLTQGTYKTTGLDSTLDSGASGIAKGTADTCAVKNVSGSTKLYNIFASIDATSGNNQSLGVKLALDGTPIDQTECRAFFATGSNQAKLVTNWQISVPHNSEVALFVANHSGTNNIVVARGRIVAATIG